MSARQVAFLVALGITVGTLFYLLGLLLVTDSLFPLSQGVLAAPIAAPPPPPRLPPPPASSPTAPARSAEDQLLVTDPRTVALRADDVSAGLGVAADHTRYFDNARVIDNSATPDQVQDALRRSGRLNGFQIAFTSDDPATSELSAGAILNFTESYETSGDAERALQDAAPLLAERFPRYASLGLTQELPSRWPVGRQVRVFEGWSENGTGRTPLYAVIFCRKNVLAGVIAVGMQREKLMREANSCAQVLDKRIKDFGRGLSA